MIARADLSLLADDLTGACDLAAAFSAVMGPLTVHCSLADRHFSDECCVLNTQSRQLPAAESQAVLRQVGQRLTGKRVIFKKVDSALRGPVGAELEGMLAGLGTRRVILAPAIPHIGKTTCQGMLFEYGAPVTQSAYAGDPSSPVRTANIAAILAETGQAVCRIADAETDEDLQRVVDESLEDDTPILFVGSLGLADAVARRIEPSTGNLSHTTSAAQRITLVSGSLYERTQWQIQQAMASTGAMLQEIEEIDTPGIEWFRLRTAPPVIVRLGHPSTTQPAEAGSTAFLNAVAKAATWVKAIGVDGLGIIGGETAYHLLQSLGASRLRITGRMAEVIAYGTVLDGALAGCPIALKGGSVGPDDALALMIRYLQTGKGGGT